MKEQEQQRPPFVLPEIVWKSIIAAVLFFMALTIYANHNNLDAAIGTFFWWCKVFFFSGLVLIVAHVGTKAYAHYHEGTMRYHERRAAGLKVNRIRIQNEIETQKLEVAKQIPALIKYAIEAGHNVELSPKMDVKVTNYLSNVHTLGNTLGERMIAEARDFVPEPYKMSDVLQNWQPSESGILLAKGRELITVPIGESLCHTTFTGNTDAGKTNNERMLMIQLAFLGQCIYLCDRNYQPFREDKKLGGYYNYKPIEAQLSYPPITDTRAAVNLLKYLYSEVEGRRLERRKLVNAYSMVPFQDKYLFFDELPAFAYESKEIMAILGRLLRESRQYGVFVIVAAQDLLNQTLNNDNGAIRDNLLTNYYGGGDITTARLVLNLAKGQVIDESGLGVKGMTYLRAKGIERVKTRTPLCDDLATHMLLDGRPSRLKQDIPRVVEASIEDEEELPRSHITRPLFTGDQAAVYTAIGQLSGEGRNISSRNVGELTDMGHDKANKILNELIDMGVLQTDRQTVEA